MLAGLFVYGRSSSEKSREATARILADALKEIAVPEEDDYSDDDESKIEKQ